MKKAITLFSVIALAAAMIIMTSCGKSEMGLSIEDPGKAVITAVNSAEGDFVGAGTLTVGEDQIISVAPEIEGDGAITISFIKAFDDIDDPVEELGSEDAAESAELTETVTGTEPYELAIPAGDYYLYVTSATKVTGTVTLTVTDAPDRSTVEPDYGTSELYTKDDMDKAVKLLNTQFFNWKGCEMHSIRYAGDECNSEENLKWLNDIKEGKEYTECIEFLTDFHSPVKEEDLEGTAWEPDQEYTDYQWWFARTDGGEWEFVSCGY